MKQLPPYIVGNNPEDENAWIVKTPAQEVSFPLSEEDKQNIQTLIDKYDSEERIGLGLAAPQIGISRQIAFINIPDDPQLRKWRPNLGEVMHRTVLLNPSYEAVGEEKDSAYEACFSIEKVTGPVSRYTTIRYRFQDMEGSLVSGVASGFLARVLQHEIDHLRGTLFIDYIKKEDLISIEEYIKLREQAMQNTEPTKASGSEE